MKGAQVKFGTVKGRDVAALIQNGVLQDLLVGSDQPGPETIYVGKATRPVKGQGGMFFDTPDGSAFLRGANGIAPGEFRLLQVTGYAEPGKAIPVTDRILYKSQYAIATADAPGINISRSIKDEEARVALRERADIFAEGLGQTGLIVRTSAADADPDAVEADIARVLDTMSVVLKDKSTKTEKLIQHPTPEELAWREWPAATEANDPIEEFLDEALEIATRLPGGGSVYVEATRACVTVDVNTGTDTSQAAGLKANLAVAKDLPRLLRVKGLGGQVVVDFAPAPKKDRQAVETALRNAFRADAIETALVGWTKLGHFEMTRKRARMPLHEVFG
ncbi:ribonuclease E/G [Rhodobacteraceae bacterium]|nr:ribonuclease E/G [Paracoccaceae bacterium]